MKRKRIIHKIEIEPSGTAVFYFHDEDNGVVADELRRLSKIRVMLEKIEDTIQEFNENNHWY